MHTARTGKREQILDVAGLSVIEKGFAATSIEEIIVEVGIILSRVMHDKNILPRQVMLYRQFVKALFVGT